MVAVLRNKIRRSRDVKAGLEHVSLGEGSIIGGGLALALIMNTIPEAAVDEWVLRFPALVQLEAKYGFLRPTFDYCAKGILATSMTGARWRTYSGAGISLMDMGSDLFMLWQFTKEGRAGFAFGILATVLLNMCIQIILVVVQNRRMGKWVLAREILTALSCLKPAVDAYRVAVGTEKHATMILDGETELSLGRITEIVCESLPSGIMQTYAFVTAKEKSTAALVSILCSAGTMSFVGTVVSWDFETSPKKRREVPSFYGYVKNDPTSRTLTFFAMLTLTCSHVIMKTLSTALLASVSVPWLMIYMGADLGIFLGFKICRRDFRYWVNVPNGMSLAISVIIRVMTKLLTDFTLVLQMRNPFEIGGVLFLLLILQNQIGCFVIAKIYERFYVDIETKLPMEVLWTSLIGLSSAFLISTLAFVGLIDRDYLHTFFTTTTAKQSTSDKFYAARNDKQRLHVFKYYPDYYAGVSEELKDLLHDNWREWMRDRPEWLTDEDIQIIPDEFLPVWYVKQQARKNDGRGRQKRNSLGEVGDATLTSRRKSDGNRNSLLGEVGDATLRRIRTKVGKKIHPKVKSAP